MRELVKPPKLNKGDRIAAVSLSWGGAGDPDFLWRYRLGQQRLRDVFGLELVPMPNTLKGSEYIYNHPEKRAEDLMAAFADPSIKGIFTCIGGDDSIRLLPYIDFDVIRRNPKVFLGYSDTTVTHFMCMKAGLSSMYGPSILAEFAENREIFDYTVKNLEKALFGTGEIGNVPPSEYWTGERIEWTEENKDKGKTLEKHTGYEVLQGSVPARGRLIGGCIEVIEMLKGTSLWDASDFDGAILFFDTSEDMIAPREISYILRNYGAQGILGRISGMIWSKPYANKYYDEYKGVIRKTLAEFGADGLTVLCNANFGHTEPMFVLPYGAMAEIDPVNKTFTIMEPAVVNEQL